MKLMTIAAAGLAWLMLAAPAAEAGGSRGGERGYGMPSSAASYARTSQFGRGNAASTVQSGGGNRSIVIQRGTGNTAQVVQDGSGNVSKIIQIGDGNTASVHQTGSGNRSVVVQIGDRHATASRQAGGQRSRSVQTGQAGRQPQNAAGMGYWVGPR
jgi:hypothetical protein